MSLVLKTHAIQSIGLTLDTRSEKKNTWMIRNDPVGCTWPYGLHTTLVLKTHASHSLGLTLDTRSGRKNTWMICNDLTDCLTWQKIAHVPCIRDSRNTQPWVNTWYAEREEKYMDDTQRSCGLHMSPVLKTHATHSLELTLDTRSEKKNTWMIRNDPIVCLAWQKIAHVPCIEDSRNIQPWVNTWHAKREEKYVGDTQQSYGLHMTLWVAWRGERLPMSLVLKTRAMHSLGLTLDTQCKSEDTREMSNNSMCCLTWQKIARVHCIRDYDNTRREANTYHAERENFFTWRRV